MYDEYTTDAPPPKPDRLTKQQLWEQGERLTLTVEIVNPSVIRNGSRQGLMVFNTLVTDVTDAGTGEELGSIGGGTGYVTIGVPGAMWMISHADLWNAFMQAREEQLHDKPAAS